MTVNYWFGAVISVCLLALPMAASADNPPESGFFDDYSRLEPVQDHWIDYLYISENFREKLASTQTLVIPQPEMFLAPDSKYKGMNPNNMKVMTDTMQELLIEAFVDGYQIANSAGPNTLNDTHGIFESTLEEKAANPGRWLATASLRRDHG